MSPPTSAIRPSPCCATRSDIWRRPRPAPQRRKRFQESAQRSPERVAEAKQQLEALAQGSPAKMSSPKRVDKLPLAEAQQAFDASNAARRPSRPISTSSRAACARWRRARLPRVRSRRSRSRPSMRWKLPTRPIRRCQSGARRCAPRDPVGRAPRTRRQAQSPRAGADQPSCPTGVGDGAARSRRRQARQTEQAHPDHRGARQSSSRRLEAAKRQAEADREAQRLARPAPAARSLREGHRDHPAARKPMQPVLLDEGKSKLAEIQGGHRARSRQQGRRAAGSRDRQHRWRIQRAAARDACPAA